MAVAAFLASRLRDLDTELEKTLPRVHGESDTEAIHDMRVAIRRLRVVLALARKPYGRFIVDHVRAGFTEIHRSSGALRDEEVLEETLANLPVPDASFVTWRKRRKERERALRKAMLVRLEAGVLSESRKLLHAMVALPVKPKRDKDLGSFARKSVERARREVESLRDAPTTDVVGLHDLRIAYKHLRYAAEVLGEGLPADLAAMSKPAAHFQKRLGEIHDVDVAIECVTRARGMGEARLHVLAALHTLRDERVAKYVRDMTPAAPPATIPPGSGAVAPPATIPPPPAPIKATKPPPKPLPKKLSVPKKRAAAPTPAR